MKKSGLILIVLSIFLVLTMTALVSCSEDGVKITYDATGGMFSNGNPVLTLEKNPGTLLVEPLAPSKTGAIFVGWATTEGGSEFWDFNTDRLDANTTLYAIWRPAEADLIAVTGADITGTEVTLSVSREIHTVIFTDKVTVSESASWVLAYDSEGVEAIKNERAANLALGENIFYLIVSAKDGVSSQVYTVRIIKDNTVTVILDANAGNLEEAVATVACGESFTLPVPTREGHIFLGWYLGTTPLTDGDGESIGVSTMTETVTLVATWQKETYTVTANVEDVNAGSVLGGGQFEYGSTFTLSATAYIGQSFVGWYEGDNFVSSSATCSFTASKNRSFTARFEPSPEMHVFTFTSDLSSCKITGLSEDIFADIVTEITIPEYVTEIEEGAFESAVVLSKVNFLGTRSQWENNVTKSAADFESLTVSYADDAPVGGGGQGSNGNVDNNGWTEN